MVLHLFLVFGTLSHFLSGTFVTTVSSCSVILQTVTLVQTCAFPGFCFNFSCVHLISSSCSLVSYLQECSSYGQHFCSFSTLQFLKGTVYNKTDCQDILSRTLLTMSLISSTILHFLISTFSHFFCHELMQRGLLAYLHLVSQTL